MSVRDSTRAFELGDSFASRNGDRHRLTYFLEGRKLSAPPALGSEALHVGAEIDCALATGDASQMRSAFFKSGFALAAFLLSGCAHVGRTACATSLADVAGIDATIRGFYDVLRRDDQAGFQRLTTPTFYSFDGGERYNGTALAEFVRDAHARGVQLTWNVGPIDTHGGCGMAWAAWENSGSVGKPPQVKPVLWLESAVLVKREGTWKIDFFHSARAKTTP